MHSYLALENSLPSHIHSTNCEISAAGPCLFSNYQRLLALVPIEWDESELYKLEEVVLYLLAESLTKEAGAGAAVAVGQYAPRGQGSMQRSMAGQK